MTDASSGAGDDRLTYDAEEVAGVFGRAAPIYDSVIPFFARFGARLVDLAGLEPGERVLDVGSGRGATLFPAATLVGPTGEVLGVDLSEEMVARLTAEVAARGAANVSVRRTNVEELEVVGGAFDVAIVSFVLHLVPEPERAAARVLGALRAGGRCVASAPILSAPGWEFLGPLLGSFLPRVTRPVAVPFRLDFDLPGVLASAGFDVARVGEEEIEFSFADERAWWTWAWSGGLRALFEVLEPDDLEALRQQAFAEMAALRTADGLAMRQRATFVVARKPQGSTSLS